LFGGVKSSQLVVIMSDKKQQESSKHAVVDSPECELVDRVNVKQLEGKLKTLVEGMGLPKKQETAQKDMVNSILWSWYNDIYGSYTDSLHRKREWYKENKLDN